MRLTPTTALLLRTSNTCLSPPPGTGFCTSTFTVRAGRGYIDSMCRYIPRLFLAEHLHFVASVNVEGPHPEATPRECAVAPGNISAAHPQVLASWGLTPQLHPASHVHLPVFVASIRRREGRATKSFPWETVMR